MSPTERIPNLKRLREAQGLNRQQLADRITATTARGGPTITTRTLDRWESGETPIPEKHWAELTELFGCSVAYLLGWDNGEDGDGEGVRAVA